jgi:hypothetical protein
MAHKSNRLLWWLGFVVLLSGIIYISSSLLFYSLGGPYSQGKGFQLLGTMRMPTYADLRWVTATSDCGVVLDALYQGNAVGCDAFGRKGIGYPPMSIWLFRLFQFQAGWTDLLALFTGFAFLATSGFMLMKINKNTGVSMLISGLLLWGYPVQLGLERMNIDVLVYILVALNCYLLSSTSMPWRGFLSLPLITATVGMKIFPLFGYIGLLFTAKPIAKRGFPNVRLGKLDASIILVGCTIGILTATPILLGNDVLPAGSVSAGDGGIGSHGLKAFGFMNQKLLDLYGLEPARITIKALFFLKLLSLGLGATVTFFLRIAHDVKRLIENYLNPNTRNFIYYILITMTCMWIGCYVTTISYDYRLIFLFPFIAILAQLTASQVAAKSAKLYWTALVAGMTVIPGIFTTLFIAKSPGSLHVFVGHEVVIEFIMLPIVAGTATALMIQLLGMTSFLSHPRPATAPALLDPHR